MKWRDVERYNVFKLKVTQDTIGLLAVITSVLKLFHHDNEAASFLIGGSVGIAYLLSLTKQIDNVEKQIVSNCLGILRFGSTAVVIAFLEHHFSNTIIEDPSLILWSLCGFMTFRALAIRHYLDF